MIRLNDNYDIISKYKNIGSRCAKIVREICHKMRQIERKILAKEREARSCERDGGKIFGGKISRPMSRLVSFTGGD